LWLGYFVFGYQMIHSIVTAVIVYLMLTLLPRSIARHAVLTFALGYVSVAHIYRMYVDYLGWSLDFTGPQMLLTLKFTFYAFDLNDMYRSKDEIAKMDKILAAHVEKSRLLYVPSTLQYFSYMFWYGTFLAGPTLCPRQHFEFVDMTTFPDKKVPSGSLIRGLLLLGYGFFTAAGVVIQGSFLPVSWLLTAEYAARPIIHKMLYLWVSSSLQRCTYYFAWLLAEGQCVLSGMGFNGVDEAATKKTGKIIYKWDRASNVRPLALESATSIKEVTENWNLGADRWLRYYIYLRLPPPFSAWAMYITYVASAFWHGFYPGYYVTFVTAAFSTEFFRGIFRKIRPRMLNAQGQNSWAYAIISRIVTSYTLAYTFVGFLLLSWERIILLYSTLYFHGHIFFFAGLFLLAYVIPSPLSAIKKAQ
jgi:lysophospholipid acyltransferase